MPVNDGIDKAFIYSLEKITPLSLGLRQALNQELKIFKFKKGELLLKEGEINNYAYFLVKGTARLYYKSAGKEITSRFIEPGQVAISYYSYFGKQPSFENLEMLEECVMEGVKREDFDKLYKPYPELNFIMRMVLEQSHIRTDERVMILQKLSAAERYDFMLQKHPEIFQKTSLEVIASFLGVTRETLSRIRAKK